MLFVSFFLSISFSLDLYRCLEHTNPAFRAVREFDSLMHWVSSSEEHPFSAQCSEYEETPLVPKTSIYDFTLPKADAKGIEVRDLFVKLKSRIQATMNTNVDRTKKSLDCIQKDKKHFDTCIEVHPEVAALYDPESEIPSYPFSKLVRQARFNVALAQSSNPMANLFNGGAKSGLNWQLDSLSTHKEVDWKAMPFNSDEYAKARSALSFYHQEGRELTKDMPRMSGWQQRQILKKEKEYMRQKRLSHLLTYQMILASNPVMQFIESENPDEEEVVRAIHSVKEKLDEEQEWLDEKTESLQDNNVSTSLLSLLNYRQELESVLSENPQFCSMVKELITLRDAKNMGFDLSLGLLIMGGSFLFPPALAVTGPLVLGAGGAAAYAYIETERAESTRYQAVGRMRKDTERNRHGALRQLTEEEEMRNQNLVLGALGLGSVRSATRLPGILKRAD